MKTAAIIQARIGSTRLPGKILKDLQGKTVLQHVIERVRQAKSIDDIIIATTTEAGDDAVVEEAVRCGATYYRGSESDVLARYYYAAKENHVDVVVRITSDCPLIDPMVVDDIVTFYKSNNEYNIVTNASSDMGQRTYPRGLDTEVFSFESLEEAFKKADKEYQREHVTLYIYEHSAKVYYYKNFVDFSKYRWTLDTDDDFALINEVYQYLYSGKHDFYLADIIKLFKKHPELYTINAHIEQKKIQQN